MHKKLMRKTRKAGESLWPESSGCRPPLAAAGEDSQFPTPPTHTPGPIGASHTLFEKPYGVSTPLPSPGTNPCQGGEGVSSAVPELGFKPEQSYRWGNGGPERSNNLPQVPQLLSGRTRTIYPNSARPPPPYSRPCGLCGWCFPLAFVFFFPSFTPATGVPGWPGRCDTRSSPQRARRPPPREIHPRSQL